MTHRKYLLLATAFGEGGTGILALASPSIAQALLLGVDQVAPEASFFARIAGAALLALGVVCWFERSDKQRSGQRGLLVSVLIFDVAAAVILAYSGLFLRMAGIAFWPAVLLHVTLAVWCVVCIGDHRRAGDLPDSGPST
jgi:hypothetical protein